MTKTFIVIQCCYINSIYFLQLVYQIVILTLGIENSFPNPVIRRQFLQKYYQLLLHKKYPKKESKLMLVGPPDSGKTSWFCPFEGKCQMNSPLSVSIDHYTNLKYYFINLIL